MKILFLPNWNVLKLRKDKNDLQSPDKQVTNIPYWFFKHMPNVAVDIIDFQKDYVLHKLERKIIKNYFYQCLKAFLRRKDYDVVISHGAQSGLFYSLLTTIFSWKNNPLHVIIDIGGMNGARINSYETPLIRLALKSKPSIIYHSESQIELYKKAYPELLSKSKFIRFGVDSDFFVPQSVNTENFILSFGYDKRDYETLTKAWLEIESDTILKIIGIEGKSTDRIIYERKVTIHQLKDEISRCLFVVIPLPVFNYSYGQMSFLQSMAMGKPVIVTKTPSTDGYLIDEHGTFYVNPYDVMDMTKKINYLLSQKKMLKKLGLLARKQIDESLNEKIMSDEIYSFMLNQLKDQNNEIQLSQD